MQDAIKTSNDAVRLATPLPHKSQSDECESDDEAKEHERRVGSNPNTPRPLAFTKLREENGDSLQH